MEREDLKGSDDLMCWHLGNNININVNSDEHSHTNDPDSNSNSHNNSNSSSNSNGSIDRILPSSTTASSSSRLLDKYIMQEDVCVPYCMSVPSVSHKIHGIAEVCTYVHDDLATAVLSLFDTSGSSQSTTSIALYNTPHSYNYDPLTDPTECPPGPACALACTNTNTNTNSSSNGKILQKQKNIYGTTILSEIPRQYVPCPTQSLQRQILCLTNRGVHFLKKNRPIDNLHRILLCDNFFECTDIRAFFELYGGIEFYCMCIALACGVPWDAGGTETLGDIGGKKR